MNYYFINFDWVRRSKTSSAWDDYRNTDVLVKANSFEEACEKIKLKYNEANSFVNETIE